MDEKKQNEKLAENYHRLAFYRLESDDGNKVYALKRAYHQRNILSRIQKVFRREDRFSMLEIGPGMGCLADLITEFYPGATYTVVDNNQGTLDEIRSRFPNVKTCLIENESQLASISGKFDVIVAIDVWEHLPSDSLGAYTRWCYGSLNSGGLFILQFPNWGCPLTPNTFCSDLTHVNQLNEKTVQQLFALVDIPDDDYSVFNRRTPGVLGAVRDVLMEVYCVYLRMQHILFGTVRLRLFAPDLVTVVQKSH